MFAIDIGEWDSNYLNEKRHFSPPSGTSCSQVVHQWRSFFFFPVKGPFFCFFRLHGRALPDKISTLLRHRL